MSTTSVFRCCKNCGSAEDVRAEQATCPGCGASYLEQAEAKIRELEALLDDDGNAAVLSKRVGELETKVALMEKAMEAQLPPLYWNEKKNSWEKK